MMNKLGLFVSGTDTGIGKTLVSSLIVSSLAQNGIPSGYFKPVQTGSDWDTETVFRLSGIPKQNLAQSTYSFFAPQSPNRAAALEGVRVQLDSIVNHWDALEDRAWVVEGAGGLLVPLNQKQTMRDLILALRLKLLLVASTRLGTINHTLLSVEAAQSAGVQVAGIVLVGQEDPGLDELLLEQTGVPIVAKIPIFDSISSEVVQLESTRYFNQKVLRSLFEASF